VIVAWLALQAAAADVVVPRPPEVVPLDRRWVVLHARVGEPLVTQLRSERDPGVEATYAVSNGPPGFAVQPDGRISWIPDGYVVGRWRVSVRIDRGLATTWTGFELDVWPKEGTVTGPVTEVREVPPGAPRTEGHGIVARGGCFLGLGVAAGGGKARGSFWQSVGEPEVRGSVSPHGSVGCSFGEMHTQWVVGLDSAPFLTWPELEFDGRYALAVWSGVQTGGERWKIGPFATAGAIVAGLGGRFQWFAPSGPARRAVGLEIKVTWLAPGVAFAGSGGVLWTL
jgi:hypothetical protein